MKSVTPAVSSKLWEKLFSLQKLENASQKLAKLVEESSKPENDVYIPDTDGTPYKVSAEKVFSSADGFSSDIYTITLSHPNNTEQTYFVKVLPLEKDSRKVGHASGVHERELRFYSEILPAIKDLIKEKNLQIDIPVPKLFYGKMGGPTEKKTNLAPDEVIVVLEDLKHLEYLQPETKEGCSTDHIHQIVRSIAIYHAAASAYLRKEGTPPKGQEWLSEYKFNPVEKLVQAMPSRLKLLEKFGLKTVADKMEHLLPHVAEVLKLDMKSDLGPMRSILHGDLHVTNMLFRYTDDKKIKNVSLVDWQRIGLGHPSYDLIYYLFPHASSEFLEKDLKSTISMYWQTYAKTLEKFGHNIETEGYGFKEFALDWNKNTAVGALLGLILIPALMLDQKELEAVITGPETTTSQNLKERLTAFVNFCDAQGIFDTATKTYCPVIASNPVIASTGDLLWEELFKLEKGQTASSKMEAIMNGTLVTEGKDGFYVSNGLEQIKVSVARGSKPGDGYACETFCLTATYPDGRAVKSFAKLMPNNPMQRGFIKMMGMQDREIKVYRDFHRLLRDLIASKGMSNEIQVFAPKLIYEKLDNKPPLIDQPTDASAAPVTFPEEDGFESILVIEDIKAVGFELHDKRSGVSLPCVRMALNALAQYHASASALLRKSGLGNKPEGLEWLTEKMSVDPSEFFQQIIPSRLSLLRTLGATKFADKLEKVLQTSGSFFQNEKIGVYGPMETICHGDFWNNNMMFNFGPEKEPKEFRMYDWQLPRVGHPAGDLVYYLLANTTGEFRKEHLKDVLAEYYATYRSTLEKLGHPLDGHTLETFQKEYRSFMLPGIAMALIAISAIMMESADAKEMVDKMNEGSKNVEGKSVDTLMENLSELADGMMPASMANDQLFTRRVLDLAEEVEASGILDEMLAAEAVLSEEAWEELFKTEKGQSASAKLTALLGGELVSEGKDGFYLKDGQDEVKISVSRGSKPGDGYACDTFCIVATFPDGRKQNSFVKLLPTLPVQRGFLTAMGIQDKEIKVYRDVHKAVRDVIASKGLSSDLHVLAPKLVYAKLDDNPTVVITPAESDGAAAAAANVDNGGESILVIENLVAQGFELHDKRSGVGLACVRTAINALAQYHAGGSALLRKTGLGNVPEGLEWICEKPTFDPSTFIQQIVASRLSLLRDLGAAKFADQVEKVLPTVGIHFQSEKLGIYGQMETICHGDFWNNNMMFKFGPDKQPIDFRMYDWQLPRIAHPAMELFYYLLSNTTGEFRKAHSKDIMSEYYTTYKNALEKLGYSLDGHTFETFTKESRSYMIFGIIMALVAIPGIMMQSEDAQKMSTEMNEGVTIGDDMNEVLGTIAEKIDLLSPSMAKDDLFTRRLLDLVEEAEESGVLAEFLEAESKVVEEKKDEGNLSKTEWGRVFETEKGQSVAGKLEALVAGKDAYYVKEDQGVDMKVEVARGSAPGDNYACVVFAVTVTRANGTQVVGFSKVLPENPTSRMFAKMMLIQDKEIKMYDEMHATLRKMIADGNVSGKVQIKAPKVLYSCLDPSSAQLFNFKPASDVAAGTKSDPISMFPTSTEEGAEAILVLEDLRPLGYRLNDKRAGSNLAHVRMATAALAHYHASTSALMRKSTTPPKNFGWLALEGVEMNFDVLDMLQKMLPTRVAMLRGMGVGEFGDKLEKCLPRISKIWDPKSAGLFGPMETVLHGDFWNNNMMFKYSATNEPEDIQIVDWQMPRLGHPAADLSYYLLTNTTSQFRKENQTMILKEYFDEFDKVFKTLGCSLGGYTYETFMKDWRENIPLGTIGALMALPPVMMEKAEAVEMKDKMDTKKLDGNQGSEEQFVSAAADLMASFLPPALLNDPLFKERVLGLVADVEATGVLDEWISRLDTGSKIVLTEKFWENLYATEKGQTISQKLMKIAGGELNSGGKDCYIVRNENAEEFEVKAEKASEAGDNFMSDVFILAIKGANAFTKSAFVKVLPGHASLRSFARSSKVHDREIKMYRDIFPHMRKLLKAAYLDEEVKLAIPEVYYTRLDAPSSGLQTTDTTEVADDLESVIVLEDLRETGFKMNDKRRGCDEHHVRAALTALAHYHAVASALLRKKGYPPKGYEWMTELSFDPAEMFKTIFSSRSDLLKRLGFTEFAAKFEKLQPLIKDLFVFNRVGMNGPTETISHGDFWNNNMLFSYDKDEKATGMRILDWQVPRIHNPGYDLANFILGGTVAESRRPTLNACLLEYFEEYKRVLMKLGYDIEFEGYSEKRFFEDWRRSCLRGLIYAIFWVPGIYEKSADVSTKLEEENDPNSSQEKGLAETLMNAMGGENDEVKRRVADLIDDFGDVVDDYLANKITMD